MVGRVSGTSVPRLQPTIHHQRPGGFGQLRPSAVAAPLPHDDIANQRRAILRQLVARLRELRRRVAADERRVTSTTGSSSADEHQGTICAAYGGPPVTVGSPRVAHQPIPDVRPVIVPSPPQPIYYRPAELEDDSSSDTVYDWTHARALPMERPDQLTFHFDVLDELFASATTDERETMGADFIAWNARSANSGCYTTAPLG
jgi:hypothetical protein